MDKAIREKHYESEFEFPLLKKIMQYAEDKDISYSQAAYEVLPEWNKGIRYRDKTWEDIVALEKKKLFSPMGESAEVKAKGDK
jgi:hypothetical protein